MAHWLLKSEPDTYSWDEQVKRGAKGEPWTGVRNHQAKNNLLKMKKGDLGFFYHSGEEKAVVDARRRFPPEGGDCAARALVDDRDFGAQLVEAEPLGEIGRLRRRAVDEIGRLLAGCAHGDHIE